MEENKKQQKDENTEEETELSIPKYSKGKLFFCYFVALVWVSIIVFGLTTALSGILTLIGNTVSVPKIIAIVATIYFFFRLTLSLGNHWRTSDSEIGTAVTNFPNPFYDPNFQPGPLLLQRQYNTLYSEYRRQSILLKNSKKYVRELEEILSAFESKLRVLLRHNDNSNRLIRSLNFLYQTKDIEFVPKMLRNILAECVTVLEKDQSDKSISLFQVRDDKLIIIESVRINAESIVKRTFEKGQGFAGYIWEKEKPEIVNEIDPEDNRFNDFKLPATPIGSILGFPLKVDGLFLGVLCLQSEEENGFNTADLRTIEYYSRLCTMVLLYDKMKYEGHKEGA
ncbi:GAF domain-containing protein [Cytobacillus firmus]|uniref:GAF domain-containing protein n=1 Tax=Cytobacillus firmus TaxID=1399 RepID=A0AA46P5R2_CYTFI|nr:GAF domain-containing protein [Cytobacillus firmus]UYG98222.1 GAF domain-containing protein [Cytobacillus firmus]